MTHTHARTNFASVGTGAIVPERLLGIGLNQQSFDLGVAKEENLVRCLMLYVLYL